MMTHIIIGKARRYCALICAVLFFALGVTVCSLAKDDSEDKGNEKIKSTVVTKEIEGEVSWLGKNKIAVIYKRDAATGGEYEMLLFFDKDVALQHKQNLAEIHKGDIVNIQYEETTDEYKDKETKTKMKAKMISFIKPAQPSTAEAETLVSGQDALPLKGIKGD